jgi:hypothetical protein
MKHNMKVQDNMGKNPHSHHHSAAPSDAVMPALVVHKSPTGTTMLRMVLMPGDCGLDNVCRST